MTESDCLQAQYDIGDVVTFAGRKDKRVTSRIEDLNLNTATVRQGQTQWRVPYQLIDLHFDTARQGRRERLVEGARDARTLLDRHGLQDWTFRFSAARRTIGSCREKEKIIQHGRHHAATEPPDHVTDTTIHEIAHALAGNAAGHRTA